MNVWNECVHICKTKNRTSSEIDYVNVEKEQMNFIPNKTKSVLKDRRFVIHIK